MANLRFPAASTPDVINNLPFEVLDHIFQDCLDLDAPSYDLPEWPTTQRLFPYNASNVCARWRQILTAHNRYWKYVVIDIAKDTAPFLDVIAQFHADYKTKGVVIFSSIRNQTPVPQYYTADFENARAEQIVKRLMSIVSVCTHVIFNLVYQSSLPSVVDILRPYNAGLTQVCLTCIIHDCDEAVVGVADMHYPYPEGFEDNYPETDSTDSDEEDDLDSDLPESPASNGDNPPAHIADETEDAPTTNVAGPHDQGNEPAPEAMKHSNLSALTKLYITGVGFREMFELGSKWQWKAFPPGNDKLDFCIDHLRIGPYLHNGVESCHELNSLTQFTTYISCMSCRITFSDISLHYSVQVDDPEHFDSFMTSENGALEMSTIEFPELNFIKCDEDFIAGFLRYTWNGDTLLEVDSPSIIFDGCFIPEPYGPREMEIERDRPRSLLLINIPLDAEDVDEANNGSAGNPQRENSSVVHALKWFPHTNNIHMVNCHGLSHSVLMTLARDIDVSLVKCLNLHNCTGFTATTIRDIIEHYQYIAEFMDNPNIQMISVDVTRGPLMNAEDASWFYGGGPENTSVSYHSVESSLMELHQGTQ